MAAPSGVFSAVRRLPVVVILGATGTGKSKLAIEIGRKLNGEIISADAMQLYQGLDIITNKVTPEEQDQCLHHMIGYVDPHSFYTVTDFRNKAVPIIDGLLQRGKLPIIVGGTNYYIEALLWNILIGEEKKTDTLVWEERPLKKLRIKRRKQAADQTQSPSTSNQSGTTPAHDITHEDTADRLQHMQCEHNSPQSKETASCTPDGSGHKMASSEEDASVQSQKAQTSRSCETMSDQVDSVEGANCQQRTDVRHATLKQDSNTLFRNIEDTDVEEHQKDQSVCHKLKYDNTRTSSCNNKSSSSRKRGLSGDDSKVVSSSHEGPEQSGIETTGSASSKKRGQSLDDCNAESSPHEGPEQYEDIDIEETDSATLHRILADVDPERAGGLHPNDRRKIIRSLQVYEQQGISHSELLARQHKQTGASSLSGPLRYPNLCILWLKADMEVLRQRLDARVDEMMARGLVEELADFHKQYNQQRIQSPDTRKEEQYVNGIFQSIGFKEFHEYLILSDQDKATEEGRKLLEDGIERMKIATRQYARKQNKWVRNRFIKRPGSTAPSVYSLDTTDKSKWSEVVLQPALNILEHLLQGKNPPVEPVQYEQLIEGDDEEGGKKVTFVCDVCQGKLIVGHQQWQAHLKSRTHAKRKRKAIIRNWEMQQKQQMKEERS